MNFHSNQNNAFEFHPEIPPPQAPQHNWQWIQLLQEKDTKIADLIGSLKDSDKAIKEQDDNLDKYEDKIELLKKELKQKSNIFNNSK